MNKQRQVREFTIGDLLPIGMTIVVLGIGLGLGGNVIGDIQDDFITGEAGCNSTDVSSCGTDYSVANNTLDGLSTLAGKISIIALAVVAAVIIYILYRYLGPNMTM